MSRVHCLDMGIQDGEESKMSRCGWTLPSLLLGQAGRFLGGGLQVKMMSEFLAYQICGVYEDVTVAFGYSVLKFGGVMWAGDSVLEDSTCTWLNKAMSR